MSETNIQKIVNYFFHLKCWDCGDREYKIIYPRFTKTAKLLLELSDNDAEEVKKRMYNLMRLAESRELQWTLETLLKKWFEINNLKPKEKEKKLYYRGDPVVEKNGKKYVIVKGDWLEFAGDKKDLEIKYE